MKINMKMKFLLPLVVATFLSSGYVMAEVRKSQPGVANQKRTVPQIVQPKWKVFTPPDKSFQVLMPGRPKTKTQVQKTYMGEIELKIFVAQPPAQEVAYLVAYNEFPYSYAKMNSPQKILNRNQANTLKTTQSNLISARNIRSSNGHPGKEIQYKDSAGKVTTNRMYVAQGRLYQVMAIVSKRQRPTLTKTITGYLNSFQLVVRR